MKFSKSELDIIYQYAAPTKAETLAGMKEIVPVIKDLLTKAIVENAIRKLEKIPEPECSQFVAATKARFLAERDNSIRRRQSYRSRLCRGMTCQERNGSIRKPGT
mgnify:CR=1 FL=1